MSDLRWLPSGEPDIVHLAFLVAPKLTTWVLLYHVDDGGGGCTACFDPDTTGGQPWPCALYVTARRVREVELAAAAHYASETTSDTLTTEDDLSRRINDRWFTREDPDTSQF